MKPTLLPCPFCGGKPNTIVVGWQYWICCETCGAKVYGEAYGEEGPKASIEAWNRRAADVGKWELLPVIGIDKETAAYINRCRCSKCWQVYKLADVAGLQMKHCPNCGQKKRDL